MSASKISTKKDAPKKIHVHLWDIPKKFFPRTTKAKAYVSDLIRISHGLRFTNQRVQYGVQICTLNIKSINRKSAGYIPSPPEVFRGVEDFVYDYENYCFRLYSYREKLLQFINSILPVGYTEDQVKIEHILINPIVKQAKMMGFLEKFKKDTSLSRVISDRNSLTHKLYYGKEFDHYFRPKRENDHGKKKDFEKWCTDWLNHIRIRGKRTNSCTTVVFDMNNELAMKIVEYKKSSLK